MKKEKGFWMLNVGLLYTLPWLTGFLPLKVYPFASSLYYSFTSCDLFNGITKTGLLNYEKIFTNGDIVGAFMVMFKYAISDIPLKLAFALLITYILSFKLKDISFFGAAYYIPSILGGSIIIAILWRIIFSMDGLISTVITLFGSLKISWMADANSALFMVVLLRIWQFDSAMAISLAVLRGMSRDSYETTSIGGVGEWAQFLKITVPLITPIIFHDLITQLCRAFQEFSALFLVTEGGPNDVTTLTSMLIYNDVFLRYKIGMTSAQARILFLIVMTLIAVAFISQKEWVYYSDGEER